MREVSLRRAVRAMVLVFGAVEVGISLASAEDGEARSSLPRVRVTTAQGQVVGQLAATRDLTLAVEQAEKGTLRLVEVRHSEILRLEVSRRPSRKGRGVAVGALAGACAAFAFSRSHPCARSCPSSGGGCEESYCVELALMSGLLTVPVGALLGYLVAPGEKWRPADVTEVSLQPGVPRGGGVALRLVVGF